MWTHSTRILHIRAQKTGPHFLETPIHAHEVLQYQHCVRNVIGIRYTHRYHFCSLDLPLPHLSSSAAQFLFLLPCCGFPQPSKYVKLLLFGARFRGLWQLLYTFVVQVIIKKSSQNHQACRHDGLFCCEKPQQLELHDYSQQLLIQSYR